MTLLEILVNHLDTWPYADLPFATQDFDCEIWFSECLPHTSNPGLGISWNSPGITTSASPYYPYNGLLADDYATAIVTEDQWQKEVRRRENKLLAEIADASKDRLSLLSSTTLGMRGRNSCRQFIWTGKRTIEQ